MSPNKSQPFHWRRDVREWLSQVFQYQRRSGLDFHTAASHCQQSFPTSDLVAFAGQTLSRGIAMWAVKAALKEAAAALDISLDDATFDFLADLAVDVILPAAA